MVVSSCTSTERNETLTNCVTTPCMDMKTIGIPPCTGTPGQPHRFSSARFDLPFELTSGRSCVFGQVTKLFFKMAASAFEFVAKKRIFERSVFSVESQYSVGSYCSYILFNSGCKHLRVFRSTSLPYICKLTRDLANVQLVWD